jgi:hypothetical protein
MGLKSVIRALVMLYWACSAVVMAGDCTHVGPCRVCGRVENNTPWEMLYTTDPGDTASEDCFIYNWNEGKGGAKDIHKVPDNGRLKKCTHITLDSLRSVGGNVCFSAGTDVDAFTVRLLTETLSYRISMIMESFVLRNSSSQKECG